jgi:hypothetical protein
MSPGCPRTHVALCPVTFPYCAPCYSTCSCRGPCQWLRSGLDPFATLTALEEAEIIPDKDSDTGIKPLALTNGHGRCTTVTPERALASVGECPLNIWPLNIGPFHFINGLVTVVSLLKPPSGSRIGFKNPLGLLKSSRYNSDNSFARRGRQEWL